MTARRLLVSATFGAGLLLALACNLRPKEGASCTTSNGVCLSKTDALFCVGLDVRAGKYEKLRCLGPDGCRQEHGQVHCDMTKTDEGAACLESGQAKSACSADGKGMLLCNFRRWHLQSKCFGAKGCTLDGTTVRCDESIAEAGDACPHDGRVACTADGKVRLVCKGEKMVPGAACGGPAGCHIEGDDAVCDGPAEIEGGPCEPEGSAGCESDGVTHLSCKDGRMGSPVACHGANGCKRVGNDIFCDRSIAEESEPCIVGGVRACSTDGTKVLTCTSRAFVVTGTCRTPCKVVGATTAGAKYSLDCR
jgi:hypothetical protein